MIFHIDRTRWSQQKRTWSSKVNLYEIELFDPDGNAVRQMRKVAATGHWSMVVAMLLLLAVLIIIIVVAGVTII